MTAEKQNTNADPFELATTTVNIINNEYKTYSTRYVSSDIRN